MMLYMCVIAWLLLASILPDVDGITTSRWSPEYVQCSPSAVFDGFVRNTRSGSLAMPPSHIGNELFQNCSAAPATSCSRLLTPDIHIRVTSEGHFSLSVQSTNSTHSLKLQFIVKEINMDPYNGGCLFLDLSNISNRYTSIERGTITQNCSYSNRKVLRVYVFVRQCSSPGNGSSATGKLTPIAEFDPYQKTEDHTVFVLGPSSTTLNDVEKKPTLVILIVCCGISIAFLIAAILFYRHKKGRNHIGDNKEESSYVPSVLKPMFLVGKTQGKHMENANTTRYNVKYDNLSSIETNGTIAKKNETNSVTEVDISLDSERDIVMTDGTYCTRIDAKLEDRGREPESLHPCRGGQYLTTVGQQPLECSLIGCDFESDEFASLHETHCQFRPSSEVYSSEYYRQLIGKINGLV